MSDLTDAIEAFGETTAAGIRHREVNLAKSLAHASAPELRDALMSLYEGHIVELPAWGYILLARLSAEQHPHDAKLLQVAANMLRQQGHAWEQAAAAYEARARDLNPRI